MYITHPVKEIISHYGSDNPGTKSNLIKILMAGKLAGTGKLIVLPVDQGFEHGPNQSFSPNPPAYDPEYHVRLAIEAGLSAYAAPLGMIESIADQYAGAIPLILKINSANSLYSSNDQAVTAHIKDAIRLGCSAIGFTIYPGSSKANDMIEELAGIARKAKELGLAVIVWSYPRGEGILKENETAVDVISYAAHIAALLGAHIIKVKLPTTHIANKSSLPNLSDDFNTLSNRVKHIKLSAFAGKRIVLFSGGSSKDEKDIYNDAIAIKDGGGNGSIIGRNVFQRDRANALDMLDKIIEIYRTTV